jgi:hypothetical protein
MKTLFLKNQPRALNLGIFTSLPIYFYSTDSSLVVPVKSYENADTMRLQIMSKNKGKSGIYMWVNNENGKLYIGSDLKIF